MGSCLRMQGNRCNRNDDHEFSYFRFQSRADLFFADTLCGCLSQPVHAEARQIYNVTVVLK
jgi:hypothetical protein